MTELYDQLVFYYLHEELINKLIIDLYYGKYDVLQLSNNRCRRTQEEVLAQWIPQEEAIAFSNELIKVGIVQIIDGNRGFRNDLITLDSSFKEAWEEKMQEELPEWLKIQKEKADCAVFDYSGFINSLLAIAILTIVFSVILPLIFES